MELLSQTNYPPPYTAIPDATTLDPDVVAREELRNRINCIADGPSREGILSDILAVVVGLAQLTAALATAQSLEEIRGAAGPLAVLGAEVNAALTDGTLVLPYMVKGGGPQGVLADMIRLSNGVSTALQAGRGPEPQPAVE